MLVINDSKLLCASQRMSLRQCERGHITAGLSLPHASEVVFILLCRHLQMVVSRGQREAAVVRATQ